MENQTTSQKNLEKDTAYFFLKFLFVPFFHFTLRAVGFNFTQAKAVSSGREDWFLVLLLFDNIKDFVKIRESKQRTNILLKISGIIFSSRLKRAGEVKRYL